MKLSIDGKQIELKGPKTLLEAARENDISIPSLCDHPHLTPFSGCRLCLVKIKGRKGYVPSCSTYAEEGMEVQTQSPRLKKMRKQIMEFILSEHPNACLICREKENCDEYKSTIRKVGEVTGCVLCPNNGRCELQDVVADLNIKRVSFPSRYRELEIKKRDPFFDQNYNLCILCGRCVRVCQEVRGNYVLTFVNRGTQTVVGTVLDRPHTEAGCQFCGACVDACPTGALTERELKYEGLPDRSELTICGLCGMGCELQINLKEGRMVNSSPSEKGVVNQGQACVKGRFTLKDVLYSEDRVLKPMIRRNKHLEEVEWDEALDYVAHGLRESQGEKAALFSSTQLSCEDGYISQKFAREVLKTGNIATPAVFSPVLSLKKLAAENGMDLGLNFQMEQISQAQTVFLVGTDIPFAHPIVWLNVLKALQKGARFIYLSPYEFEINRHAHHWIRNRPGTESFVLHSFSQMILQHQQDSKERANRNGFPSFKRSLKDIPLDQCADWTGVSGDQLKKAARILQEDSPVAILFGGAFSQVPWKNQNLSALWNLSLLTQADLFPLEPENNTRGMGVIHGGSNGPGRSFNRMVQNLSSGKIKALYQIGPVSLPQEIKTDFRVLQDSFVNAQSKKADALLPAPTFLETEGIFVNTEGRIQKASPVVSPLGDSRPDWWILSQLAQRMGKTDFKYKSTSQVRRELRDTVPELSPASSYGLKEKGLFLKEKEKGHKKFIPVQKEIPVKPTRDYPYLMVLEGNQDYYRSFHLSEKIKGFRVLRNTHWLTVSPDDAKKLKLKEDQPVKVESEEGEINRIVKISSLVSSGTVKTRFHWDEPSNSLINFDSSPFPSIRALPVRIKRG